MLEGNLSTPDPYAPPLSHPYLGVPAAASKPEEFRASEVLLIHFHTSILPRVSGPTLDLLSQHVSPSRIPV